MKRITIKFGKLPSGATFWEKKDECGYTFTFPLTKIEPEVINGDWMTARAGAMTLQFKDSDLVEVDN